MIDRELLELAGARHGVLDRRALTGELGRSGARIRRAIEAGTLVVMTPRAVRVAGWPDSFLARCAATSIEVAESGFIGGASAARLYGLRRMPTDRINVTVPHGRRLWLPGWAEVHHSSWCSDDDRAPVDIAPARMAAASPLRMLWSLAATFNQFRFERAAEDAWHRALITPAGAADYLQRHRCRGKNGVARLELWLERTAAHARPAQSGLELDLLAAIERIGLPPPIRQHPLRLIDGETIHIDIAWPSVRLGVEPGHSWWHGGDRRQRLDQARDVACGEVGWQILRFDETAVRSAADAARRVLAVYRRRRADLAA